jgi:DNA-binding transcriptional LysR family regulator
MSNSLPKQFYYKRNRLQQLKGFYYTVQEGSPSKAAKIMRLTKSTLTLQIKSLERDLDLELFTKNKNRFKLTKDGEAFYKMAVPYIQGIDGLYERFIFKEKIKNSKIIKIAAHHIAISYLLPKYLKEFHKENPNIKIHICNISKDEATQRLKREEIDLMLYPTSDVPHECRFKPIFKYDPILLMHKDHPLADTEVVSFEDMSNHQLVRIDPKLITLPLFEEAVKTHKIGSNIEFENGNWEMLKHFVQSGDGMALVSTICFEDRDKETLVAKSMSHYFPPMVYGVMVKKGRYLSSVVQKFVKIMDPDFFNEEEVSPKLKEE